MKNLYQKASGSLVLVVAMMLLSGGTGWAQTTITFPGPGTYSWICPAGVNSISVAVQGAGGGGGRSSSSGKSGAGGGGGACAYNASMTVVPATTYTVTVGAGGAGEPSGTSGSGSAGGNSSFSGGVITTLTGGGGGGGGSSAVTTAGPAGTASGGAVNNSGGSGAAGGGASGGGGGGSAGTSTGGGSGSGLSGGSAGTGTPAGAAGAATVSGNAGANGSTPGAGGAGGLTTSSSNLGGGNGGSGQVTIVVPGSVASAPFTMGDLAVMQADNASANNTTFTILDVNPSSGSLVNTIPISGAGSGALRISGSAGSAPFLAESADGTLLCFAAANSSSSSAAVNGITARGVGTLNSAGAFVLQTTYSDPSAGTTSSQPRGATSLNNSAWYICDQSGLYSNGTSTPSPSGTKFSSIKSFGSTVYVLQNVASTPVVSTVSAATGGTVTGLPGLAAAGDANASDFYLISSGANGSTFDILYTIGSDGVKKYSLVSGTWTQNGTNTATTGYGLCAVKSGSGAAIYVTTGAGGTAGNTVAMLTDSAGFNSTISSSASATLYTCSSSVTLKGIAFVPVSWNVTYNGNGNTGGTAPTDSNAYGNGATVTVLGNTGNLVLSGYAFNGWNTAANGTGTSYSAGSTFTISANTTLYAQWAPTYTVTYNGNGNTGGSVPTDSGAYTNGATVTVLANTGNLVDTGYTFEGWNTAANGSGTTYAATGSATFTMGSANVTLYALWTQSPIITPTPGSLTGFSYGFNSGPSASQSFTLAAANLSSASGNLTISGSADYEVSTDNSSFGASKTLAYTANGATFTSGNAVYVRLKSGLGIASYNSESIGISDGNGTTANVTASGSVTNGTPPAFTPAGSATVDNAFNVIFPDNATWRSAISSIAVNGTTLTAGYNVSAGQITFTPSTSSPASLLQTAGSLSIAVIATGYNNATVTQTLGVGAANKLAITTQPTGPRGNGSSGDALVTSPVVQVQDQYGNLTASTVTITASVGAGSWMIGGATSTVAVSGTATFTNLTASSASAVSGATITFTSGSLTSATSAPGFNLSAPATAFTAGNLAVFQCDNASLNNSTITILELSPSTAAQSSPVNIIPINATGGSPLRTSSAATTGLLADSGDGSLLAFTGFQDGSPAISDETTILSRAAATLNSIDSLVLQASYTGISGDQTRCATSPNESTWYMSDKAGIYLNGGTSPVNSGTLNSPRGIKCFGGTIYLLQQDKNSIVVSTVTGNGSTVTPLPGLAADNSAVDFYMISSQNNGTYDTLYVIDNSSATSGAIKKYSLSGGTWSANGSSYATSFGGDGMCVDGSGNIYVTTGSGGTAGNSLMKLTDANANTGGTLSITTGNNVTLYTAGASATLKGVAFAPKPAVLAPVIGTSVTNTVPSGTLWKISILSLSNAAAWSDPNGYPLTLSSVGPESLLGTNITSDGTYIYYGGPVTANDSFTYVISNGYLTATGSVSLVVSAAQTGGNITGNSLTFNGGGHPTFSGNGIPGLVLGVESATSANGPWIEAGNVTVGSNGSWTFTDPNQTNPTMIFYRMYYPDDPGNPPQ